MIKLKITVLLMVLVTGLSTAKPQNFVEQGLPTPPQLEISPAWMAEEDSRTFELQGFILRSPSLDLGNWDCLTKLEKGKKIRVVDASLKKTKGSFLEANENQLKFKAGSKVVTLNRDEVRMVSLRFGPSTGERILLGILAGALIGASAYAEARMCEKHGCWDETYGWYEAAARLPRPARPISPWEWARRAWAFWLPLPKLKTLSFMSRKNESQLSKCPRSPSWPPPSPAGSREETYLLG